MLTFVVMRATRTEGGVTQTGWVVQRRGFRLKPSVASVLIETEDEAWALAERIAQAERGLVGFR